jgi:hypothetical protein
MKFNLAAAQHQLRHVSAEKHGASVAKDCGAKSRTARRGMAIARRDAKPIALLAAVSAHLEPADSGIDCHECRVGGSAVCAEAAVRVTAARLAVPLVALFLVRLRIRSVRAWFEHTRAPRHICARRHAGHTRGNRAR